MPMPMTEIEVDGIKKETDKCWVVWVDEIGEVSCNFSKRMCERVEENVFRIPKWLHDKISPIVS